MWIVDPVRAGLCACIISVTIVMKACSTFMSFLALVSKKEISCSSASSCIGDYKAILQLWSLFHHRFVIVAIMC